MSHPEYNPDVRREFERRSNSLEHSSNGEETVYVLYQGPEEPIINSAITSAQSGEVNGYLKGAEILNLPNKDGLVNNYLPEGAELLNLEPSGTATLEIGSTKDHKAVGAKVIKLIFSPGGSDNFKSNYRIDK